MELSTYFLLAFACWAVANANPTTPSTITPKQEYHSQPQEAASAYVPHAVYPFANGYPNPQPPFDGYIYGPPNYPAPSSFSSIIPAVQQSLIVVFRLLAKVGLFVIAGIALLLVGGVFTTAVCSLTPICTITFAGLGGLDKDTVRALMTPDNISTTAALVKEAIDKYQNLQRSISS